MLDGGVVGGTLVAVTDETGGEVRTGADVSVTFVAVPQLASARSVRTGSVERRCMETEEVVNNRSSL